MLYGLGVSNKLSAAKAALPECLSQELMNCLNSGNVDGLPKAQCDAINHGYDVAAEGNELDHAINALPVCKGPSVISYAGVAFGAGMLVAALVLRR